MINSRRFLPLPLFAAACLTACGDGTDTVTKTKESAPISDTISASTPAERARFDVINTAGIAIGTVTIADSSDGVDVILDLTAIPAGEHAIHFHENGACDAPDFKSAGGHWNPADVMHGFKTETGPHAGDMRNFTAPDSGVVRTTVKKDGVSLSARDGFFDLPGHALIIHAGPDDYESQPSGDAGGRIACALIAKG